MNHARWELTVKARIFKLSEDTTLITVGLSFRVFGKTAGFAEWRINDSKIAGALSFLHRENTKLTLHPKRAYTNKGRLHLNTWRRPTEAYL